MTTAAPFISLCPTLHSTIQTKAYCCSCRRCSDEAELKQCSKCKIPRYCSRSCQLKHYPAHKSTCQLISKLLSSDTNMLELAHATFTAAYESCDVPERGAYMMELALQHYCEVWTTCIQLTTPTKQQQFEALHVMLVLLLVALERHDEASSLIHLTQNNKILESGEQVDEIRIPLVSSTSTNEDLLDNITNPTLLVLLLILKLRLVVKTHQPPQEETNDGFVETTTSLNQETQQQASQNHTDTQQPFHTQEQLDFMRKILTRIHKLNPSLHTLIVEEGFQPMALAFELYSKDGFDLQNYNFYLLQDLVCMTHGVVDLLDQVVTTTM